MTPGTTPAINARIAYIELLRKKFSSGYGCDEFVMGQLADLRHFCDARGLDYAKLDQRAYNHYWSEKGLASVTEPMEAMPPPVHLHIPLRAWQDVTPAQDRTLLRATVRIEGVTHILWATKPFGSFATVPLYGKRYVLEMVASNPEQSVVPTASPST